MAEAQAEGGGCLVQLDGEGTQTALQKLVSGPGEWILAALTTDSTIGFSVLLLVKGSWVHFPNSPGDVVTQANCLSQLPSPGRWHRAGDTRGVPPRCGSDQLH